MIIKPGRRSQWPRSVRHDPCVRVSEDRSCLRPRGHCDRPHRFILSTINVIIRKKSHYKIWLRRRVLAANTLASLETTLAAEAYQAEGQFLLEEQRKVSDIPSRNLFVQNLLSSCLFPKNLNNKIYKNVIVCLVMYGWGKQGHAVA
jgi:hypothetical protein